MPLACDTQETIDFALLTDRLKPEGERPTFVFKFVHCRDWLKMSKLFAAADEADNEVDAVNLSHEGIKVALVGWRNIFIDGKPASFNHDDLDLVTSVADIHDIRLNMLEQLTLTELDKKKFARQSLSNSEHSAQTAKVAST